MLYYSDQLEVAINAMKSDNEQTEIQKELLSQHELCNAAHEELKEEDMKFSMAQIEFLYAYITYMMQPDLDADELQKLHHNAKIWTIHAVPPFTPVNLRSDHLIKEDLKHLGYNVGKFLRHKAESSPVSSRRYLRSPLKAPKSERSSRNSEKANQPKKESLSIPAARWISCSRTFNDMATSTWRYLPEPGITLSALLL